jgi:hypothetical protein
VRINELQLAQAYRTSVNALLRQESIHVDLAPRFRKLNGDDEGQRRPHNFSRISRRPGLETLFGVQRVETIT